MGYKPQALPNISNKSDLPTIEKQLNDLVEVRDEAAATYELTQFTMKNWIQLKFTPFIIRDKVWLEAQNLKRNIVNPKFTAKREGPFKIKKAYLPYSTN